MIFSLQIVIVKASNLCKYVELFSYEFANFRNYIRWN